MAWPQFDAAEVAFWQRLRDSLAAHTLQLVLASTGTPPSGLDIPHLPVVPSIDAYWPGRRLAPGLSLEDVRLDAATLLAREAAWGAPSLLPSIDAFRRGAMDAVTGYWTETLLVLQPAVVVIWNGQHVSELILDAVCRACAVPVLYVERAPIPQALFADDRGLSAASAVARQDSWTVPAAEWLDRAAAVVRWLTAGQRTWWEQPASRSDGAAALRRELGIPDGARVVLFAAQIDQDTQQFLFSPHFDSNLAAFAWLLDQLRGRDGVFVLGKHHPKSLTSPTEYERVLAQSGVNGVWRTDLAIDDALAIADRVAAVNSTVLYEALARDRPVLALGEWLLRGRGAGWDIRDRDRGREAVDAWWVAAGAGGRQSAWRETLAFLLSRSLYTWAPELDAVGVPGAPALAARIAALAPRLDGRTIPPALVDRWIDARSRRPAWTLAGEDVAPDHAREWQRAHTLRHQLLHAGAAVRRGRRLVVWGAGTAGRAADELLAQAGVRVAAFVSTSPDRTHVDGRALLSPDDLMAAPARDFVLVASQAAEQIVPLLASLGFTPSQDYSVLDVDQLATAAVTPLV